MQIKNIVKKFHNEVVFKDISLEFEKGSIYSIFGENGVGKTTLLNMMNGNLSVDQGSIVKSSDNIIFIENNLIPFDYLTADEFIEIAFDFKNIPYNKKDKEELYLELNLNEPTKSIKDYSEGMKSKLLLIIALLSNPDILLLDEPFSDLDNNTFKAVMGILNKKSEEMILIFSTHVADIAYMLSDKVVFLRKEEGRMFENDFDSIDEFKKFIEKNL